MEEIWKDIEGYEGLYQVSNLGNVRSVDRIDNRNHFWPGKVLKQQRHLQGYLFVCLSKNNIKKTVAVHRLVAKAFIENPENKPCVDHIDTDVTNNSVHNLRFCTTQENSMNPLTRKHQSDCKKGNKHNLGNHLSEKTKKKISQANSTPVIATNIVSGEELFFSSITKACECLNCSSGNVSECCLGKRTKTKGYRFTYAF